MSLGNGKRNINDQDDGTTKKRVNGNSSGGGFELLLARPPGFILAHRHPSLLPQGVALNDRGVQVPYIAFDDDDDDSDDVSDEDIIISNDAAKWSAKEHVNGCVQVQQQSLTAASLKINQVEAGQSSQPRSALCSSSSDRRMVVTRDKSPVTEDMQFNFEELKVISKHIHYLSEKINADTSDAFKLSTELNQIGTTLTRVQSEVVEDDKAFKEIDNEIRRLQRHRRKLTSELNAKKSAMNNLEERKKHTGEALTKILDGIQVAKKIRTQNEEKKLALEATHTETLASLAKYN